MTATISVVVGPDYEAVPVDRMTLEQAREAVVILAGELEHATESRRRALDAWNRFRGGRR